MYPYLLYLCQKLLSESTFVGVQAAAAHHPHFACIPILSVRCTCVKECIYILPQNVEEIEDDLDDLALDHLVIDRDDLVDDDDLDQAFHEIDK